MRPKFIGFRLAYPISVIFCVHALFIIIILFYKDLI